MPEERNQLVVEITELIIKTLDLEDVSCGDIEPDAPLFREGLGLDSIDALELGVALQKNFNLKLNAEDENMREHFYSVQSLAKLVSMRRGT